MKNFFIFVIKENKQELSEIYNFCCLKTGLDWESVELGVGQDIVKNCVKIATGMTIK